jgi:hypothetical protein
MIHGDDGVNDGGDGDGDGDDGKEERATLFAALAALTASIFACCPSKQP